MLGPDLTEQDRAALSLERLVDDRTPPSFLWSTADDEAVPVSNSLRSAQALVATLPRSCGDRLVRLDSAASQLLI